MTGRLFRFASLVLAIVRQCAAQKSRTRQARLQVQSFLNGPAIVDYVRKTGTNRTHPVNLSRK